MPNPLDTATEHIAQDNAAHASFAEGSLPRGGAPLALSFEQRFLRAASALTRAYLCAILLGLPLVFTNYYFNITETKQVYFLFISGFYLLLLLLARIALPPDYGVKREKTPLHPAALALIALFVVSVTGSLLSRYPGEAFFGENNRYQGLMTLFCYACLVFALSRRVLDLRWPEVSLLLGACLVSALGVLHHFGVDPIGFMRDLRESDRGRFLSTIGNANFYASFIVMAFAVSLGGIMRARGHRAQLFSALALILVSFGVLVAGSDSAALGMLALFVIAPLLSFSDARALRRLLLVWGIFFLCAFVFGLIYRALDSATYLSAFFTALSRPAVSLPLFALMLALSFALARVSAHSLLCARRVYTAALLVAALLSCAALILLNTTLKTLPLGGAERYLRFSESWGTDRGKIWMFALRVYEKLPFVQQLFGASSGALFHADAVSPLFSDAGLDAAHNEYLQYLITNGALGLASYLATLAFAIRAGILRTRTEPIYRGLTLAVVAYAAQATVNIAQPMTTPILFVLIGILVSQKAIAPVEIEHLPA
jgi:O-antigen ligase